MKANKLVEGSDLLFVWNLIRKNFLIILICPLLGYGIGSIYAYRLVEIYGAKCQLLLQNNETYEYQDPIYQGLGAYGAYRDVQNQMRILQSREIVGEAVERIDCNVAYFVLGRINKKEVFGTAPFSAEISILNPSMYEVPIFIKILDTERYTLEYESAGIKTTEESVFGSELINSDIQIVLNRNFQFSEANIDRLTNSDYQIIVHSDDYLIQKFQSNTSIYNLEHTSILEIMVNDELQPRAKIYLDTLAHVFSEFSVKNQLEINTNTLENIEKQIQEVEAIIDSIETQIIFFKDENSIIHVSKEENEYFEKYVQYSQEDRLLNEKKSSVIALKEYVLDSKDGNLLPPSLFILDEDEYLNETISQLYDLQLKAADQKITKTTNNPEYENLTKKIGELRKDLLIYSNSLITALSDRIEINRELVREYRAKMEKLPISASGLENLDRQLDVNNKMYLFLLERRINTLIARAGIIPQAKVIEKASGIGLVRPDKTRIKYLFLIGGLIIALVFVVIKSLFFDKISDSQELKSTSSLNFIGEIPLVKKMKSELILESGPKTSSAESFRNIRTNLAYLKSAEEKTQVMTFSSFYPSEGKTFTSVNLADLLSRSNKKVMLLDLDLHKPRVHKIFGRDNKTGVSDYLVSDISVDDIKNELSESLHVCFAGTIAPNPSELILRERFDELLDYCRKNYDYVLVDTPPFGLLNDALSISKKSDTFVVVSNAKYLTKRGLRIIEETLEKTEVNTGIILNGTKQTRFQYYYTKYSYKLGYSYAYKYGYGAYEEGYYTYRDESNDGK